MVRRTRASDPTKHERRKAGPVETRQVAHPQIWATALRLADGERERITVESFGRVTVMR